SEKGLERALRYEAQFLPQPNALCSLLRKAKPTDLLSCAEVLIEVEYYTKLMIHHQRWYYRLSDTPIDDALYDLIERRLNALEQKHPKLFPKDHPIHGVGY
ncbi:hypothetical protein, partial [Candidatus Liberibacter solanacearum]